jgi:hypothetical protein
VGCRLTTSHPNAAKPIATAPSVQLSPLPGKFPDRTEPIAAHAATVTDVSASASRSRDDVTRPLS